MPWLAPAAAGYVSLRSFSRATSRDAIWTASVSKAHRLRSPARARPTSLTTRHWPTGDAFGREGQGPRRARLKLRWRPGGLVAARFGFAHAGARRRARGSRHSFVRIKLPYIDRCL